MKLKSVIGSILVFALITALFAGCGGGVNSGSGAPAHSSMSVPESENNARPDTQDFSLEGSLTLIGSTSMNKVANALAEGFKAENPGVNTVVGGNGSGEGSKAVSDGTAQIGLLSRNVKAEENPDSFDIRTIAIDGVAVIAHKNNRISSLTKQQIADIYTGKITNWKEIGGKDEKIVVIGREAASGTRGAFEELLKIEGEAVHENEYNDTGIIKQNVAQNPGAIGYVSLSSVDDTVYAIPVEGVTPSEETLIDGSYAISRPFLMINKKGNTSEILTAFYEYMNSEAGQELIKKAGVVPAK